MAILTQGFKTRDEYVKHFTPNILRSAGVYPTGEFFIAPWLPLAEGLFDQHTGEYFSAMAGKCVALTRDGFVVPAGWLLKFQRAASGDTVLTYTQTDVDNKVYNLATGAVLTATTTVTKGDLTTALRSLLIIRANESCEDYISAPVGVLPYCAFNSFNPLHVTQKGLQRPSTMRKINFSLQKGIAILCDYVLYLPWVPESVATQTASAIGDVTSATATQAGLYYFSFTATGLLPIAQPDGTRVPMTISNTATHFRKEKFKLAQISATGDFMVNAEQNRIYFFAGSLANATAAIMDKTITFYHYNSTSDAHATANYACVVGPVSPGDYLIPTSKSNYIPASYAGAHATIASSLTIASDAVGASFDQAELQAIFDNIEAVSVAQQANVQAALREEGLIIGQVLEIVTEPRDMLEKVQSHTSSAYAKDNMPGSATKGLSDSVTFSRAANKRIAVNIIRK